MAKVPLRLYNREIENLIDRKQTEEATAHCRHILQIFPKHIDTYRLLGKAYLESQKYGEAVDIFQRVISVIPDDFVSHVGMSIIREDEGNLDAAIWHMERAFEVAPANAAVQEELRRLYSRRDGVEPPKVRLTRGALVRMYAKGDLYDQAINEIRSTLAEEPDRIDMQVMLARMYLANGQRIEATEICSTLLAKFPFCWAANQILAEILPGTARSEDTQIYQQRLAAMDPYVAYLSPIYSSPADVPDNLVLVERLDWDASQGVGPVQPGWAESLGLKIEESFPLDLPDWLNPNPPDRSNRDLPVEPKPAATTQQPDLTEEFSVGATSGSDFPPQDVVIKATTPLEENLPDWMKDAGWLASEPSGTPQETPFHLEAAPVESEDISDVLPADIPDWVRSMAPINALGPEKDTFKPPAEIPPQAVGEGEPAAEDMPEWLNNILENTGQARVPAADTSDTLGGIPDWLKELKSDTPEPGPSGIQNAEQPAPVEPTQLESEIPTFTEDISAEAPEITSGDAVQPAESLDKEAELPAWLREFELPTAQVEAEEQIASIVEIPSVEEPKLDSTEMLQSVEQVLPEQADPSSEISLPSWLDTYEEEPLEDQPAPVIPSWLDGIAVEGIETGEDHIDTLQPVWFDESAAATDLARQVESWQVVKPTAQMDETSTQPDVQPEAEVSSPKAMDLAEGQVLPEPDQPVELPEWLRNFEADAAASSEAPQSTEIAGTQTEMDQSVASLPTGEIPVPAAADLEIQPVEDEAAPTIRVPSGKEDASRPDSTADATTAWLEDLAAVHASEAQTLIIRRSDREIQPPRWVSDSQKAEQEPEPAPARPFPEGTDAAESESAALENWLKELEKEQQSKAPDAFVNKREPVPKNTAALRMWLDNLLEETSPEETPPAPPEEYPPSDLVGTDQPEWLHEHVQLADEPAPSSKETPVIAEQPETGNDTAEAAITLPVEEPVSVVGIQPDVAEPTDAVDELASAVADTTFQPSEAEHTADSDTSAEFGDLTIPVKEEQGESVVGTETDASEDIAIDLSEAAININKETLPVEDMELPTYEIVPIGEELETSAASGEFLPMETGTVVEETPVAISTAGEEQVEKPGEVIDQHIETLEEPVQIEPQIEGTIAHQETEIPEGALTVGEVEVETIDAGAGDSYPADELEEQAQSSTEMSITPDEDDLAGPQSLIEARAESPVDLLEALVEPAPVAEEGSSLDKADTGIQDTPAEEDLPDWLKGLEDESVAYPTGAAVKSEGTEFIPALLETPTLKEGAGSEDEAKLHTETVKPIPPLPGTGPLAHDPDWDMLQLAEKNLWGGDIEASLHLYTRLIKNEHYLEEAIRDLKDALYQHPVDVAIWETLGDAYNRNNCLQDALDAYTKAEELLR